MSHQHTVEGIKNYMRGIESVFGRPNMVPVSDYDKAMAKVRAGLNDVKSGRKPRSTLKGLYNTLQRLHTA